MRSTSEGLLVSILEGFRSILGPNLGSKIHQNAMSKCILKMSKVEERLESNFYLFRKGSGGPGGGRAPSLAADFRSLKR